MSRCHSSPSYRTAMFTVRLDQHLSFSLVCLLVWPFIIELASSKLLLVCLAAIVEATIHFYFLIGLVLCFWTPPVAEITYNYIANVILNPVFNFLYCVL